WPASGPKPFAYPSFLQHGRGYGGNRDGFLYVYASDGAWGDANALRLGRARTAADFLDAASFTYWDGDSWSPVLARAKDIWPRSHELGGMQSIVYDEPLARYFLITFGDTFTDDARLIVFDAPAPEGPWSHCGSIGRAEAMPWLEADQTSIYN